VPVRWPDRGGRYVPAARESRCPERAAELLRDPSHVRALPVDELRGLFEQAGLGTPQVTSYRMEGEMEDLLTRSFPNEGDADRLRKIFADSLSDDALDLNTRNENGRSSMAFPWRCWWERRAVSFPGDS